MAIPTKIKSYSSRVDGIRTVALLGAILIHCAFPVYSRPDFAGGLTWWLASSINTMSRISIPLFIMLSGLLLLPKSETPASTALRTVRRLLIPLFAWFSLYAWWDGFYLTRPYTQPDLIGMVVMSNMFHLYFLVILAGLYLALPLFRLAWTHASKSSQLYITGSLLLLGLVIYAVQYFVSPQQNLLNSFTIWLPYAGYFLFGALAPTLNINTRLLKWIAALSVGSILWFSYVAVTQLGEGNLALWGNSAVHYFEHFVSPLVMLASLSVFMLFLRVPLPKVMRQTSKTLNWTRSALRQVAQASFGMYLVHIIVLNILDMRFGYAIEFLDGSIMRYFIERSALTLIFSFIAAWLIRKIPVIKWTVGE